jgi:hypothetical protein
MGMYCLNMLAIAIELASENPAYEDVASKFFEHFTYIAHAMNDLGGEGISLWNDEDGFYYDVLHMPSGDHCPMKVLMGLIPLFAIETLEPDMLEKLPGFKRRMQWFLDNVPDLAGHVDMSRKSPRGTRRLLSIVSRERLTRVLHYMLSEAEFLSPYGIRALSAFHRDHPYTISVTATSIAWITGQSSGPVWRELELARAHLVSRSTTCSSSRSEVSSLLW